MLKPTKPKLNVGNNKEVTITDKNKTPCYLVTKSPFSPESVIDSSTLISMNSVGLLPLLLGIPPIIKVEPLVPDLHDHTTRQMTIDNYNYQSVCRVPQTVAKTRNR